MRQQEDQNSDQLEPKILHVHRILLLKGDEAHSFTLMFFDS